MENTVPVRLVGARQMCDRVASILIDQKKQCAVTWTEKFDPDIRQFSVLVVSDMVSAISAL
jgi:hypothetical protein